MEGDAPYNRAPHVKLLGGAAKQFEAATESFGGEIGMVDIHAFLQDPKIEAVLARAYREWKTQRRQLLWRFLPLLPRLLRKRKLDWQDMFARTKDMYLPLEAEQGGLLYVTARAIGARRIAEYGTSFGVSTLYLAAAVRDNGGGKVIGSEILPEKVEVARAPTSPRQG